MPIPVRSILTRTDDLLLDAGRIRWSVAERIRWGNEAMGAILIRRPSAFARRSVHALQAGTYQTLPAGGALFLDLVRNIGPDGVTPGRPVRRTDRQLLDDADPNWHRIKAKAEIKQYTFDDRLPTVFYVYPPAIAGANVELIDAALPADVAEDDEAGSFQIGAEYMEPVVNYVAYRANCKDSEFANGQIAGAYYQAFEAALGGQSVAQVNASPNQPTTSV
ncbi:MAG TPA: DUF6682 family protein [Burkholderiaceae bacterium]|nr:DUF6682 family protein [Burkholderiaceae bacterium]